MKIPGEKLISSDRRSEPRTLAAQYHSVELQPKVPGLMYQFKLWNISDHGLCIVVKKESEILDMIHVDDILTMNLCPNRQDAPKEPVAMKIAHITPKEDGKFQEHFLVGLSVLFTGDPR